MRRGWALVAGLAAALVGACNDGGIPRSDFIEEYELAFCARYADCATDAMLVIVDERECHEYLRYADYHTDNPDCDYQGDAAEQCLAELADAGCQDSDPAIPLICESVFSQCPVPRVPPQGETTGPIEG